MQPAENISRNDKNDINFSIGEIMANGKLWY